MTTYSTIAAATCAHRTLAMLMPKRRVSVSFGAQCSVLIAGLPTAPHHGTALLHSATGRFFLACMHVVHLLSTCAVTITVHVHVTLLPLYYDSTHMHTSLHCPHICWLCPLTHAHVPMLQLHASLSRHPHKPYVPGASAAARHIRRQCNAGRCVIVDV